MVKTKPEPAPITTLLLTHPASLDHATPPGHPERADRIRIIKPALEDERFAMLVREAATVADYDAIALAHSRDYVEAPAEASPVTGGVQIDSDTMLSPGSFEAALHQKPPGILPFIRSTSARGRVDSTMRAISKKLDCG